MGHVESNGPLAGIRVIDFTTNVSGPNATAILGDLGADIIKIERVGRGDDARGMTPKVSDESAYFLAINRNKRSIALDFTQPDGLKLVRELVDGADVVIENFRRGVLDKYGLNAETVCGENPQLIFCSISGYGEAGDEQYKPG
jgi:crotonobetainyl-CoA:carnitine CoA-transferase CaiB-like acyl-CoA transferase